MPSYFPEGNRVLTSDNYLRSLQKMVSLDGGGVDGVGGESPSTSSLVAWYKTETLSLSDGAAVATWPDSSGNGNDVSQGTAGKRPLFKVGVLQSRDAVRFSNANDNCLINEAPSGLTTDGFTYYAVIKVGTWVNYGMIVVTDSVSNEMRLFNQQTLYSLVAQDGAFENTVNTGEGGGARAARILRGRWADVALGQGLKVSGFLEDQISNSGSLIQDVICLGARDNADATLNFDGDIGEVLIYTTSIGTIERSQTETYLANRWGITV